MGSHQLSRPRRLIVGLLAAATLWPVVARGGRSFIPIPEIITDPNEGNTVGLLAVLLFTDEKEQIQYMVAPDLRYNKTTGVFPAFRFFGYPSSERRYSVVVAKSTTKDEDYELEYTDRSFWDGRGFLLASFLHEADSTERFFGFGNESREERPHPGRPAGPGNLGGESNYTDLDTQAQATPGVWVLPYANLSYRMRIRRYGIEHGQVDNIPFIATAHPETRGRGIDFNRSLASAELRTRVYERHLFGVNLEIEVAPFIDTGHVFHRLSDSPVGDLHWVGGLGFRGVVRPQIVGFVDIGRGSEGNAIFTGIDYPF